VNDPRPAIEPFLARLCGGEVTDKNCVGYFMNEFGEELVFAQRRGEKTGRLWHGPDQMVSIPRGAVDINAYRLVHGDPLQDHRLVARHLSSKTRRQLISAIR
jgi:hypothetical protein